MKYYMKDKYFINKETGRTAKVTRFKLAKNYYVAFFNKGEWKSHSGHYCEKLSHAHGDAKAWVEGAY